MFAPGDGMGGGGVDSETVWCELFRAELLFISMQRTDRQLRLFMYNFNCLSFIIWERLEKYVNITSKIFLFFPYGYKYETLQYI